MSKSYEEAQADLEKLTREISSGKLSIDELFDAWKRGVELKKICEQHLRVAREALSDVIQEADG